MSFALNTIALMAKEAIFIDDLTEGTIYMGFVRNVQGVAGHLVDENAGVCQVVRLYRDPALGWIKGWAEYGTYTVQWINRAAQNYSTYRIQFDKNGVAIGADDQP